MTRCEETCDRMILYLDDELDPRESAVVEEHLKICEKCRALFHAERQFLEIVRQSRPLSGAPAQLRAAIEEMLEPSSSSPTIAPPELRQRIERITRGLPADTRKSRIFSFRFPLPPPVIIPVVLLSP